MKNALTSAQQSFNNFWQSPQPQRIATGVGNIIKKVKNVINPITQSGKRVINPVISAQVKRVTGIVPNYIQSVSNSIVKPISGFITDIPANMAYLQAKIGQKILPKDLIPTAEQMQSQNQNRGAYNPLNPEHLEFEGPIKSMSAQLNPWPVAQNTPYNLQLEAMKQRILNSGVFRPAMKRYLSTIPIYGDYGAPGGGMTDVTPLQTYDNPASYPGASFGRGSWETATGPYQPVIGMGISKGQPVPNGEQFKSVLAHELIHASPRNMKYKDEFVNFFNDVKPDTHPLLYRIGLEYQNNGKPPPNPEEFYAVVAEKLGPNVLKIPEIKKFYENIFSSKQRGSFKDLSDEWEQFQKEKK